MSLGFLHIPVVVNYLQSQNTGTCKSSFLLSFFPCTCHVLLCIWSIALACAGRGITISPMLTSSFYALGKRPQPLASAGKASPRQCLIKHPCFYTRMDLRLVKLIIGSFSQYTLVCIWSLPSHTTGT